MDHGGFLPFLDKSWIPQHTLDSLNVTSGTCADSDLIMSANFLNSNMITQILTTAYLRICSETVYFSVISRNVLTMDHAHNDAAIGSD